MGNISVIQAAAVPKKPVKPKKALNIALGIILSAVSIQDILTSTAH
jgi:uncharacterized protein involved in exopolysaccharide biosynthesis